MSAVERCTEAVQARDVAAVRAQLADDVEFRATFAAEPIVGRDTVVGALALLDQVFDSFEHGLVLGPALPAGAGQGDLPPGACG